MNTRTQDELIESWFANSIYDKVTGCWLWQGCATANGYGLTCWRSRQVYLHRLAYRFEHPDEVLNTVRHTCDMPNCWSVNHLINGTTQENIEDKITKGRQPIGSKVGTARFTEE